MAITASVEIVLPAEDHQQFDTYYSHWLEYHRTNNRDKVVAMEKCMRDVMSRNNIPPDVSLWSLRVWGLRLEISGQAEFFPRPCFF